MRMLAKLMRPIERQSLKRESGTWDYEEGEYEPGGINDSTKGMGMGIGQMFVISHKRSCKNRIFYGQAGGGSAPLKRA